MKSKSKIKYITESASIGAIYVVLTYITALLGLANGAVQCRLSEALCILPLFTPSAISGLFVGCLISNILTGCTVFDVLFGSVATLIGAYGTYLLSKRKCAVYLYTIPPVVANTIIIPIVLKYAYSLSNSVWYFVITVAIGEIVSCSVLGSLLYISLKKKEKMLFKR